MEVLGGQEGSPQLMKTNELLPSPHRGFAKVSQVLLRQSSPRAELHRKTDPWKVEGRGRRGQGTQAGRTAHTEGTFRRCRRARGVTGNGKGLDEAG